MFYLTAFDQKEYNLKYTIGTLVGGKIVKKFEYSLGTKYEMYVLKYCVIF